jgi:AraC family transcriptional regulator
MVSQLRDITTRVEAQASFAFGHAQIVRRVWSEPIDVVDTSAQHRVEFAMLPRSAAARGCFPDRRGLQQFEPFGEVFFFPAGQLVHAQSRCRQQVSVVCSFAPEAVENWFCDGLRWTRARLQACLNISNSTIRGLLLRLGEELSNPGFASAALSELLAGQIGIELARHLTGIEDAPRNGGLSTRNLRLIDERLGQDGTAPSLGELARLCGLSVRHLTRAFRASRQRSIGSYIAEWRILRAKDLLTSGMSVGKVAQTLGFSSSSALSSAFRRSTGHRSRDYLQSVGRLR